MKQPRKNNGQYKKRKWKLKLSAVVVIGAVGYVLIDTPNTVIMELPQIAQPDPVDVYFAEKLADYKEQLKLEEKIVRQTLEAEDNYVEFQAEYYQIRSEFASTTDELSDRFDLVAKMGLSEGYNTLSEKTGIKEIE